MATNESPLADVLAFLDEALQSVDNAEPLPALNSDDWDPNMLLEALDNENEDITAANLTVSQTIPDQTITRSGNTSSDQTQIPVHQAQRKVNKKKLNKNKARDERRFVLIQLRDEVEKLEFTLAQLQNMRTKKQNTIGYSSHDTENDSGIPAVWQEICARQLHRRLMAERENVRLKQELEREKDLVKNVQKLLYKRKVPKETGPEAEKHTRRTDIPQGYIERMAAFIFDELEAGVEIMYRQVERAIESSSSFPTVERPLLRGGVRGREEQLFDRKVLSFSLRAVGDAWWQTWHIHRGRSVHESVGDKIIETFGLEMKDFNANTSVSSYGQQILRRNLADHRVMYVWNAYMEPFVFKNERVNGIYFLEQCHVFIKPDERDAMSDEDKFSTIGTTAEGAEDLELTLKQWQDIRRKKKLSTDPKKTDKSGVDDRDRDVPAVWEEICANQLRRRLKAERENIRLKQQYKEEMQLVKRVEKLLFKRRDVPQSEAQKHIRRTNLPPGYIKHIAARIFEELSAGIEVCYLLGKNVLGVDGSIPADMASRMPLLRGDVKDTERALFDRRVLPFTRQATDHAWWHNWHSYRGHNGEIADNVVVERFGLEMSDFKTNTSVTSYGQQILRRDVEDDRTVIVWNAYLEPFAFENEQVSGIYFLEQCHMIVKPEDERTAINEGECSTCMSGCYRITPYFLDPTLQSDPRTIRLIDFLVGALFSNMKAHNDMIEDLLLEQVLQKHSNK